MNGKTGTRHLPLIESLPYVKEWLEQHPQRSNPNAYFICSMDRKKVGKQLSRHGLLHIYTKRYRMIYFPKLLNDPTVPIEDRNKIQELLKKPWNLYIRRSESELARTFPTGKSNTAAIMIDIYTVYMYVYVIYYVS